MSNLLASPILIPVVALLVGGVLGALGVWNKVRQAELNHERELELRRMEHERQMKQMDLDKARLEAGKAE